MKNQGFSCIGRKFVDFMKKRDSFRISQPRLESLASTPRSVRALDSGLRQQAVAKRGTVASVEDARPFHRDEFACEAIT